MLMLAIIGLFSAAVMRNATSGDQVANNNRLQTQANQYAQLAMRWCESQLALDSGARAVPLYAVATPPAWTTAQNWVAKGGGSHPAHTLVAKDIGSTTQPRVSPQCLMEATAVPNVYTVHRARLQRRLQGRRVDRRHAQRLRGVACRPRSMPRARAAAAPTPVTPLARPRRPPTAR